MKTTCPHCSQSIEIDSATFKTLLGNSQFACPTCNGAVPVPSVPSRNPNAASLLQTHRGLNRNILILGTLALLVLGGLAIFLASRNGGNIFNTKQNITNQIIHNSYFTQLIAAGATTEKDLKSIAEIIPHGDGFIGISKEAMTWEQAQSFAKRTGAAVLGVDAGGPDLSRKLSDWLAVSFASHFPSTIWSRQHDEPRVFDGQDHLAVASQAGSRRAFLQWPPGDVAIATPNPDGLGAEWGDISGVKTVKSKGDLNAPASIDLIELSYVIQRETLFVMLKTRVAPKSIGPKQYFGLLIRNTGNESPTTRHFFAFWLDQPGITWQQDSDKTEYPSGLGAGSDQVLEMAVPLSLIESKTFDIYPLIRDGPTQTNLSHWPQWVKVR